MLLLFLSLLCPWLYRGLKPEVNNNSSSSSINNNNNNTTTTTTTTTYYYYYGTMVVVVVVVVVHCEAKKLHRFIFAIALSELHLL